MALSHAPAAVLARGRATLPCSPPAALVALALAVAAGLRLYALDAWPAFVDEDNYAWLVDQMAGLPLHEAVLRSGWITKPPLPFLVTQALMAVTGDPVVAGRALAAVAGTVTTLLCYFLGLRLGGTCVGAVASLLYALSPIAVLHERMFLHDGPMAALALGAVLLAWAAIDRRSTRLGLAAALVGALAVQLKLPAVLITILPLRVLFGFYRGDQAGRLVPTALAVLAPVVSFIALMLSPVGPTLAAQNWVLFRPLERLPANLASVADAIATYFPLGLWALALVGAALAWREMRPALTVFLVAIGLWTLPWLAVSIFVPSRYLLPAVPYLCVLAALSALRLVGLAARAGTASGAVAAVAALAVLAASAFGSLQIVFDHRGAPLTQLDDWQYRSGWPSGYAYPDAARYLAGAAEPGSFVAYAIDLGHAVGVRMHRPPRGVTSLGLVEPGASLPVPIAAPLYVVVDDGREDDVPGDRLRAVVRAEPRLHVLARFQRPGAETSVWVLRSP